MVADIDLPALATGDVAVNYPGITEALLRLHTAYREEQLALADRGVERDEAAEAPDPVAESRRFLGARRNRFPMLDDAGEKLGPEEEAARRLGGRVKAETHPRVRARPSGCLRGCAGGRGRP